MQMLGGFLILFGCFGMGLWYRQQFLGRLYTIRELIRILEQFGYHVVLLESTSRTVVEEGLKNVHNDTCYPALLVVGQFMEALKSGKYDVDHTALLITQTGGGCRASNYIHLLRKCMAEQFPQVPVLSLNFAGLEKDCSLELTPALCLKNGLRCPLCGSADDPVQPVPPL